MYGRKHVVFWGLIPVAALFCAPAATTQDRVASLKVAAVQFRSSPSLTDNLKRISETLVRLGVCRNELGAFARAMLVTRENSLHFAPQSALARNHGSMAL